MVPEFNLCPYLYSKFIRNKVNLLILPYNYVLNPEISNNVGIDLKNSIIVFDEAHNIENVAESCLSFDLDLKMLENNKNEESYDVIWLKDKLNCISK